MNRRQRLVAAAAGALIVVGLAACNGDDGGSTETTEIRVFAAASLTDAFKEAGRAFEAANPGTKIIFNFAASSALAVQISEGAPADVFASADAAQMEVVRENTDAGEPVVFARNLPIVVVPSGSVLSEFSELGEPGLRLVLAAGSVPIGRYARRVFENASGPGGVSSDFADKVLANLKSEESNVRAVLTKVQLGEADVGVVYQTDVPEGFNSVRAIEIPTDYNVVAAYPIARLTEGDQGELADAFIEFIVGAEGQAILNKQGFARGAEQ